MREGGPMRRAIRGVLGVACWVGAMVMGACSSADESTETEPGDDAQLGEAEQPLEWCNASDHCDDLAEPLTECADTCCYISFSGGWCRNTRIDRNHCGSCGNACGSLLGIQRYCSDGHCCMPWEAWHDGACRRLCTTNADCSGSTGCCYGICDGHGSSVCVSGTPPCAIGGICDWCGT